MIFSGRAAVQSRLGGLLHGGESVSGAGTACGALQSTVSVGAAAGAPCRHSGHDGPLYAVNVTFLMSDFIVKDTDDCF